MKLANTLNHEKNLIFNPSDLTLTTEKNITSQTSMIRQLAELKNQNKKKEKLKVNELGNPPT